MRDGVEQPHGVEIGVDPLTTPFDEASEPVLPSGVQLPLDVPGNDHICLDVALVRSFQDLRLVNAQNLRRI